MVGASAHSRGRHRRRLVQPLAGTARVRAGYPCTFRFTYEALSTKGALQLMGKRRRGAVLLAAGATTLRRARHRRRLA